MRARLARHEACLPHITIQNQGSCMFRPASQSVIARNNNHLPALGACQILLLAAACLPPTANATEFSPGNLLVQAESEIREYDRAGNLLQSIPLDVVGDSGARDLTLDAEGNVHVYNGTFDPVLSTFDPIAMTFSQRTALGWSTANNGSYGGITTLDGLVFVTDMNTSGDGEASGVVRFDLETDEFIRFADGTDAIDLNLGLDGLLYVLSPGGSPEGRVLDVYDPISTAFVRTIDLTEIFGFTGHRSIATDAAGNVYIADFDGDIAKVSADGQVLLQDNLCNIAASCNLYDIDVAEDGLVVIGDREGGVTVTDVDFSAFDSFDVTSGFQGAFVSIVPPSAGDPAVSFSVSGAETFVGLCQNLETSQRVIIRDPEVSLDTEIDCSSQEPFDVAAGDVVRLVALGVNFGPDFDGAITGATGTGVRCDNTTTGQTVSAQLREGAWDCVESGLAVSDGDRVSVVATVQVD